MSPRYLVAFVAFLSTATAGLAASDPLVTIKLSIDQFVDDVPIDVSLSGEAPPGGAVLALDAPCCTPEPPTFRVGTGKFQLVASLRARTSDLPASRFVGARLLSPGPDPALLASAVSAGIGFGLLADIDVLYPSPRT
jgi:hypothetical protein